MTGFFRYPHTPHLAWLGAANPRGDKVLSLAQATALLAGIVVVEEKLDGANVGFSIAPNGAIQAQSRGQVLTKPFTGQFSRLASWLATHEERFREGLSQSLIVFGEWCTARHSLNYDKLPDWWLMFDVYDKTSGQFWSTTRRNELAAKLEVAVVPRLHDGHINLGQLKNWLSEKESCFRSGNVEGLVIRSEDGLWLRARAKLVNPDFTQAIVEHWRARPIEWNSIDAARSF
jgi:ATP-dependent RNA circularization protein (DNA/RNA ligase family)